MAFENLNSLETLNIQNNKLTRIPEEVMEPIIDTLRVVDIMGECNCAWNYFIGLVKLKNYFFDLPDNPLICSCDLIWFPNLLQDLKNRDDEMTQKKRPVCTMPNEHREYFVQSMPIERMNCIGKNLVRNSLSEPNHSEPKDVSSLYTLLILSVIILFSSAAAVDLF